jgi:uncharacterized protein (TIGR00255 family)
MTGCGEGLATEGANTARVEVRCVNNRFLKVTLRSREGFAVLESRVEGVVRDRVRRGAVQVTLDLAGPVAPASRGLDPVQLGAYLDQLEDFCASHDLPVPKTIDGLLALPGILVESIPSQETIDAAWPLVQRALVGALDGLERMRRAEGDAMARDMLATCVEIRTLAATVRERVPAVLVEHRQPRWGGTCSRRRGTEDRLPSRIRAEGRHRQPRPHSDAASGRRRGHTRRRDQPRRGSRGRAGEVIRSAPTATRG